MTEYESFLHESQVEGQANKKQREETTYISLDEAIANVAKIRNEEALNFLKEHKKDEWPTTKMRLYCHDCSALVPPALGKNHKGRTRMVCGTCGSKKITAGTEKGLVGFYHIKPEDVPPPTTNANTEKGAKK